MEGNSPVTGKFYSNNKIWCMKVLAKTPFYVCSLYAGYQKIPISMHGGDKKTAPTTLRSPPRVNQIALRKLIRILAT